MSVELLGQGMAYLRGHDAGCVNERARIIALLDESLGEHLRVCNYKAVTEEECDVCAWAKDTLELVKTSKRES